MKEDQTVTEENAAIIPRPGRMLGWFLVGVLALFAGTALLPHDPYLRFQQLSDTIHFRVKWAYERIYFDPTPIDIAVVGNSRLGAGVNAPLVSELLSKQLGREVRIVNFSTPQEGRNTHYVLAEKLLMQRDDVRMLILSVIEQSPRVTHPAFRHLGDAGDVIGAPALINRDYLADLAYLPYRQISLFVQRLAPSWFEYTAEFDAPAYRGPDYDTTASYTLPDGNIVDRDITPPEAKLAANARRRIHEITPPKLPQSLQNWEFAVERHYTDAIAELAEKRGVVLSFLYLPVYTDTGGIRDKENYAGLGPVLEANHWVDRADAFSDYGHFNRTGSTELASWLSLQIAELVAAGDVSLAARD